MAWVDAAPAAKPLRDVPLSREVAVRSRGIGLAHDDAADRFIAAMADVCGLTLVMGDERFLDGQGFQVPANR